MSCRTLLIAVGLLLALAGCSQANSDVFSDSAMAVAEDVADNDAGAGDQAGETAEGLENSDETRRADPAPGRNQVVPITLADLSIEDIELGEAVLTDVEVEGLLELYLKYLGLSDAARLGDAAAEAELDLITDPLIRYLTEDWMSRNEQLADEGLSVIGLSTTPNIMSISGTADGAVLHDCAVLNVTDQLTGFTRTEYVEQISVLRNADGRWLVSLVEVLHDGTSSAGPIRCVSRREQEMVGDVAQQVLEGLTAAWADPQSGTDHLRPLVGTDLANRLEVEIDRMADEGMSAAGEQTHVVRVVGVNLLADPFDPDGSDGLDGSDSTQPRTSYLVVSCTTFPDGLASGTATDQTPVAEDEPVSGSVYREWTAVAVIDGPKTDIRMIALESQQVGTDCDHEETA